MCKGNLYMGTFDSEIFWRNNDYSQLPSITDKETKNIIMVMDELLFTECKDKGDIILTRTKMNEYHKDYLQDIGYQFVSNEFDLESKTTESPWTNIRSTCRLMLESDYGSIFPIAGHMLSPFSILPWTYHFAEKNNLEFKAPKIEVITKMNSKAFSTYINQKLFGYNYGTLVESSDMLQEICISLLQESPCLIKEDFGVSGKGSLLIESDNILKRVHKHVVKQEQNGKKTRFIVEPYFDKSCDFSCQFFLYPDGKMKILSIHKLKNNGLSFSGIIDAEPEFVEMLEKQGYIKQMKQLARAMSAEGYYGYVCVDSMILKNSGIVPIVEINARKSMSNIKNGVDHYLSRYDLNADFTFHSVIGNTEVGFDQILEFMKNEHILFCPNRGSGIIPLSANTLLINKKNTNPYKGRLYYSVVDQDFASREKLLGKMKIILNNLNFKVTN